MHPSIPFSILFPNIPPLELSVFDVQLSASERFVRVRGDSAVYLPAARLTACAEALCRAYGLRGAALEPV